MSRVQLAALAKPINAKLVEKKKVRGQMLEYVGHATINELLLYHVGPFSQSVKVIRGYAPELVGKDKTFRAIDNAIVGALVTLRVTVDGRKVSITEAGDVENAAMKENDGERLKNAVSDGLKRCAMRLGLGLSLWSGDGYTLDKALERAEKPAVVPQPSAATGTPEKAVETPETPVETAEKATENFRNGVAISAAAATRLKKKVSDLGLSYPNEATFIESALGIGALDEFSELNQAQAGKVWAYATSEAAKAETKPTKAPYEVWQVDEDAQKWASELGVFKSGHEVMNEWTALKTKLGLR